MVQVLIEKDFHQNKEKIKSPNFDWSLKPLIVCMKFVLGLNLGSQTSRFARFLVPLFGFFIILCNLVFNGPCSVTRAFMKKMTFMSADYYNSSYTLVKSEPYAMLELVSNSCTLLFFMSTPLIHFGFMAKVLLTQNWTKLWSLLLEIQRKMKLDPKFHRQCRRHCYGALALLVFVTNKYLKYILTISNICY